MLNEMTEEERNFYKSSWFSWKSAMMKDTDGRSHLLPPKGWVPTMVYPEGIYLVTFPVPQSMGKKMIPFSFKEQPLPVDENPKTCKVHFFSKWREEYLDGKITREQFDNKFKELCKQCEK
jgi:hypothetical protein